MLTGDSAEKIKSWVKEGGTLVSEGCPAYFGNLGRACSIQAQDGLDELFGVREEYDQFTPDLLYELRLKLDDSTNIYGGSNLQSYTPTTGRKAAHNSDGKIAAVDNLFRRGKTQLIGTFPDMVFIVIRIMGPKSSSKGYLRGLVWSKEFQQVMKESMQEFKNLKRRHFYRFPVVQELISILKLPLLASCARLHNCIIFGVATAKLVRKINYRLRSPQEA